MPNLEAIARLEEEQYVHSVYEDIAEHFSRTRYKPWPGISNFFASLKTGSLGLDAGCGNGKYLGLRSAVVTAATSAKQEHEVENSKQGKGKGKGKGKALQAQEEAEPQEPEAAPLEASRGPILTIGLDRSHGLVSIAKAREHEVLVGDAIDMPWREGSFDFAISIATIHHFTTRARRKESIKTILQALNKTHGKLFIQVWAYEQEPPTLESGLLSEHAISASEYATLNRVKVKKPRKMDKLEPAVLQSTAEAEGGGEKQDVFVPWKLQGQSGSTEVDAEGKSVVTYQRYYHLFKAGELKELVEVAAKECGLQDDWRIEGEKWEEGNWWITAEFSAP